MYYDDLTPLQNRYIGDQGIESLYEHQISLILHIKNKKNMIVSMPTASGKSLIAYLSILRTLEDNKKAVYIVPLRALAAEKYNDLKQINNYGYRVMLSIGSVEDDINLDDVDVLVATSEKFDSIMRSGNKWMNNLGIAVIDEIHMIGEPNRGPTLESVISKIKTIKPDTQIVGLSATIPNGQDLAEWLNAKYVYTEWRPVELEVYAVDKDSKQMYSESSNDIVNNLEKDKDAVLQIINKTLSSNGQILMFSNSRKNVEKYADQYTPYIIKYLSSKNKKDIDKEAKELNDDVELSSAGKKLFALVKSGVAFHHAGLSNSQRGIVETLFKKRLIKLIVATPTLAAGVNLPAKTVIINETYRMGNGSFSPLSIFEIKQMCGRAGRPGYDKKGEAYIISSKSAFYNVINRYLQGNVEKIKSSFFIEDSLKTHILSVISSGFATNINLIKGFLENTFGSYQNPSFDVDNLLSDVVEFLNAYGFVTTDGYNIKATSFGKLTSTLYIHPDTAILFKRSIEKYDEKFILSIFQIISYSPDTIPLFISNKKGGDEGEIIDAIIQNYKNKWMIDPDKLSEHEYIRFLNSVKTAMMYMDWIEEVPIYELERKYGIGPGDIMNKVETATWLSYAMRELSVLFNKEVRKAIDRLHIRIANGVKDELVELVMLPQIGRIRARKLYDMGIHTVDDFVKADIELIATVVPRKYAENIKYKWNDRAKKDSTNASF